MVPLTKIFTLKKKKRLLANKWLNTSPLTDFSQPASHPEKPPLLPVSPYTTPLPFPLSVKLTSIKPSLTEAAHSHVFFHLTHAALEQNLAGGNRTKTRSRTKGREHWAGWSQRWAQLIPSFHRWGNKDRSDQPTASQWQYGGHQSCFCPAFPSFARKSLLFF